MFHSSLRAPVRGQARALALFGLAALGFGSLAGCGGGAKPRTEEDDTVIVTTYRGSYACGSARWRLLMQVADFSDGTALGTATQTSEVPPEKLVIWGLGGTLTDDGTLKLTAKNDLNVPMGFKTYGFEGKLSNAGFEGAATDLHCGPVKLERFGKAPGSELGD